MYAYKSGCYIVFLSHSFGTHMTAPGRVRWCNTLTDLYPKNVQRHWPWTNGSTNWLSSNAQVIKCSFHCSSCWKLPFPNSPNALLNAALHGWSELNRIAHQNSSTVDLLGPNWGEVGLQKPGMVIMQAIAVVKAYCIWQCTISALTALQLQPGSDVFCFCALFYPLNATFIG